GGDQQDRKRDAPVVAATLACLRSPIPEPRVRVGRVGLGRHCGKTLRPGAGFGLTNLQPRRWFSGWAGGAAPTSSGRRRRGGAFGPGAGFGLINLQPRRWFSGWVSPRVQVPLRPSRRPTVSAAM